MLRVKPYILSILLVIGITISYAGFANAYSEFYQESRRGWYWYEQQAKPARNNKHTPSELISPELVSPEDTSKQTALEELNQFKEELEERKAKMIMRPSIENTREFIKYQNEMYNKAGKVSQNIREVMLVYPELNIAREIPISDTGIKIRKKVEKIQNKELLKEFAKRFKLLFFYKASCSYCVPFAEVLEVFGYRYGFKVASVAIDGKSMEKFPASQNAKLTERFHISTTPTLFAYSEELGIAVPISQGFLAIDELENNAVYVASKLRERLS